MGASPNKKYSAGARPDTRTEEQLGVDLALELFEHGGEGGLGHPEGLGGAGDVPVLADGDELAEGGELHGGRVPGRVGPAILSSR